MTSEPEKKEPDKSQPGYNKNIILNLMIKLDLVTPLNLHMGFCRLGYPIGLAYSRVYDTSPFAC